MSVDSVANNGNWNTIGNAGLDSTRNFIGTKDQQALIFKTDNTERLRFTANGNIKVASTTIPTGSDQVQVVVIDPSTGTLMQRTIAASAFNNAIASLNGLRDTAQTFAIDSAVTTDIAITSAAGVHKFNVPTQNCNGTTSRGLLSYCDWQRFDSSARFQILHTAFSNTADANGIGGRIYTIKKIGSGGTIDGASNYIIYNDWTFVTLQTDGIDWYVIKK